MSHIIARCLVCILPSNEVKRMSNVEDITIKGRDSPVKRSILGTSLKM
jgi:hypothetical protein